MSQIPTYGSGGSVRRARERAQAGLPPVMPESPDNDPPSISGPPRRAGGVGVGGNRPQAPPGFQPRDGNIGVAISRPKPVPQWPLASAASNGAAGSYRPPENQSRSPPQRPPRPSRVPSMLDGSKIQEPTPVFQYAPQRVSELSVPETPATSSSRPSTMSSVGSIPDFPLPTAAPPPPPPAPPILPHQQNAATRRSVNLGPPPSSRRGASSFYSTASYVSPIPEESSRVRSLASYASSAAIPESFGTISPGMSPSESYDPKFDEAIAEESIYSEEDDSRLVRSASIGKRGKPSIVTTRGSDRGESIPIMLPQTAAPTRPQLPPGMYSNGTLYFDSSSSTSSATSSSKERSIGAAVTSDRMLEAHSAPSATDPSTSGDSVAGPRPFRLSTLRRPPRLNIDAVREAEARGSLTSLPDLIKRATRLAAMMDKGRRPASRFDELDLMSSRHDRDPEKEVAYQAERHRSGLSDMLAAFPPPGQANSGRSVRQSGSSWPLPLGARGLGATPNTGERFLESAADSNPRQPAKKGRRCCGLPWGWFVVLMLFILMAIAAAVVVPIELLVIQKQGNKAGTPSPVTTCQNQLRCLNGGVNVITQNVCSCICSNGFTGTDCSQPSMPGCTTMSFPASDTNLNNVTLGQAIPRLVQKAQTNFSIPLSAATITSKFSAANLSCSTENALVTFNGQSSRLTEASAGAGNSRDRVAVQNAAGAAGFPLTISVLPDLTITITATAPVATGNIVVITTPVSFPTTFSGSISTILTTMVTNTVTMTPSAPAPTSTAAVSPNPSGTMSSADPSATFAVTEQVLDFARVAVLFVLQEQSLGDATAAQSALQKLFTAANNAKGVSIDQARNISLGGSNTADLVHLLIDVGTGRSTNATKPQGS